MNKEKLIETIENINVESYHKLNEELYQDLYSACIDYMNDTQDWSLEYLFEDYIDYDTAEEIAKSEIDKGGLIRLYYFLGDVNPNDDMFKIDGYGNLANVDRDDIRYLKEEILDNLRDK